MFVGEKHFLRIIVVVHSGGVLALKGYLYFLFLIYLYMNMILYYCSILRLVSTYSIRILHVWSSLKHEKSEVMERTGLQWQLELSELFKCA